MSEPKGVVIILISLKLLQVEQNVIINQVSNGKAIALTGENNQKQTQLEIAIGGYSHVLPAGNCFIKKIQDQPIRCT